VCVATQFWPYHRARKSAPLMRGPTSGCNGTGGGALQAIKEEILAVQQRIRQAARLETRHKVCTDSLEVETPVKARRRLSEERCLSAWDAARSQQLAASPGSPMNKSRLLGRSLEASRQELSAMRGGPCRARHELKHAVASTPVLTESRSLPGSLLVSQNCLNQPSSSPRRSLGSACRQVPHCTPNAPRIAEICSPSHGSRESRFHEGRSTNHGKRHEGAGPLPASGLLVTELRALQDSARRGEVPAATEEGKPVLPPLGTSSRMGCRAHGSACTSPSVPSLEVPLRSRSSSRKVCGPDVCQKDKGTQKRCGDILDGGERIGDSMSQQVERSPGEVPSECGSPFEVAAPLLHEGTNATHVPPWPSHDTSTVGHDKKDRESMLEHSANKTGSLHRPVSAPCLASATQSPSRIQAVSEDKSPSTRLQHRRGESSLFRSSCSGSVRSMRSSSTTDVPATRRLDPSYVLALECEVVRLRAENLHLRHHAVHAAPRGRGRRRSRRNAHSASVLPLEAQGVPCSALWP